MAVPSRNNRKVGGHQTHSIKGGIFSAMSTIQKTNTDSGSKRSQKSAVTREEGRLFQLILHQVVQGMLKARENELKPFGISNIQAGVMYFVEAAKEPLTASQIARRILLKPSSTYHMLNKMEKQGLVRLVRKTEGKREVRVMMTKKGDEIYSSHKREVIPKILGKLLPEERNQLHEILMKLRDAIYAELAPPPLFP